MKQFSTFLLLLLLCYTGRSQLALDYTRSVFPKEFRKKIPKLIHQESYTYDDYSAELEINDLYFDSTGRQTQKLILDKAGKVTGRLRWHFDGKLLRSASAESWDGTVWKRDSALYTYDQNNHLSEVIVKDGDNTLLWQALIQCDSNGLITKNDFYDNRGELKYTEKVQYLREQYLMVITHIKPDGSPPKVESVDMRGPFAGQHPLPGEIRNALGDLTRHENYAPFKGKAVLVVEYTYDQYNNITALHAYKVKGRKGREIRESYYRFERKIEY